MLLALLLLGIIAGFYSLLQKDKGLEDEDLIKIALFVFCFTFLFLALAGTKMPSRATPGIFYGAGR